MRGSSRRVIVVLVTLAFFISGVVILARTDAAPVKRNCHATKTCPTSTTAATTTTTTLSTTTGATTTTLPASTTTTTQPGSCSGVSVFPRPDLQPVIDAHPAGTTFCFQPGVYNLSSTVRPKSGDQLISAVRREAILTGGGTLASGIVGSGGETGQYDITVRGFILGGFSTFDNPDGGIPNPKGAVYMGWRWTVEDNEIRTSIHGVTVNTGGIVKWNSIHHNVRYGLVANGDSMLIESNAVTFNNTGDTPACGCYRTGDSGGTKFVGLSGDWSDGITVRGNTFSDNQGNGLWFDGNNRNVLIEGNTIERNTRVGLDYEIGDVATIRDNVVRSSCLQATGSCNTNSAFNGAEIFAHSSSNVTVYGNTVTATNNGIVGRDSQRNDTSPEGVPVRLRNFHVYDNTITVPVPSADGGTSGIVGGAEPAVTYNGQSWFHNNDYHTSFSLAWRWNTSKTWAQWQALSNDATGSVSP